MFKLLLDVTCSIHTTQRFYVPPECQTLCSQHVISPLGCAVGLCTRPSCSSTPCNAEAQASSYCLSLSAPLPHSSLKDCKWKMYIELDGDDVAVTYIKDIVFNANRQDVEVLRMAKVLSHSFRKFSLNIELLHPHCL